MDLDLRFHILATFNSLETTGTKNVYLRGHIISKDPVCVGFDGSGGRFAQGNMGKKTSSFEYYVPDEANRRIKVCEGPGDDKFQVGRVFPSSCFPGAFLII